MVKVSNVLIIMLFPLSFSFSQSRNDYWHNVKIENGDLIFRNGKSKESSLIRRYSLHDTTFSHVGVCFLIKGNPYVYHMIGGKENLPGKMEKESIQSFTDARENDIIGIFKTSLSKKEQERLELFSDSIFRSKVVFDYAFSLNNKDSLYCTEFVINGIKYATKNKIDIKPITIKNPPFRKFIYNSNEDSFRYYPIDFLQNQTFLRKKTIIRYKYHSI